MSIINPRQQPLGNARFVLAADKRAGEENVASANASIVRVTEDWRWFRVTTTGGMVAFNGPCRLGAIVNVSGSAATVAIYDSTTTSNLVIDGLGVADDAVFEALKGARMDNGIYINTNQALVLTYAPMVLTA